MSANIPSIQDKNEILNNAEMSGILYDNILSLSAFLKTNYPRCPLLPLVPDKKQPMYAHKNLHDDELWEKWDSTYRQALENGCAFGITLREGLIVIDIDDLKWCDYIEQQFPEFLTTVCCDTRKGRHYYFKTTPYSDQNAIYDGARGMKVPTSECIEDLSYEESTDGALSILPIDIKTVCSTGTGGIIVVPPSPDKAWRRSLVETPALDVPNSFIDYIISKKPIRKQREVQRSSGEVSMVDDIKEVTKEKNKIDGEKLKKLVGQLKDHRAISYDAWTRVVWAIWNISRDNDYERKGKNLIHKFSERSPRYNEDKVDTFIRGIKARPNGVGLGFLMECLKEDDLLAFKKMYADLNENAKKEIASEGYCLIDDHEELIERVLCDIYLHSITHEKAAQLFGLMNKEFVNIGDNTFYRKNPFGAYILVNPSYQKELIEGIIKDTITPYIKSFYPIVRTSVNLDDKLDDAEKKKKLNAMSKKYANIVERIESVNFISGVYETIKQKTLDIVAKEKMDEAKHLVLFKNGVLDLRTMELRNVMPGEYVSMFMGSDLLKQPKDIRTSEFAEAEQIVDDWLPAPDARYFKKYIGSHLYGGNDLQLAHNLTGGGANGKSLAEEAVAKSYGDYHMSIPLTYYTKTKEDASKPEPLRLKQKGKKVGWCDETGEKTVFQSVSFKKECTDYTDDYRTLHSKEIQKIKKIYKSTISSNFPLKFTDDIDYATIRRIRVMKFPYRFVSEEDYNPNNPLHKKIDENITARIDAAIEQFNMMWVYYYTVFKKEGLKMTEAMKQATKDYINSLDTLKVFLGENIKVDTEGRVWLNSLYELYKGHLEAEQTEARDIPKKKDFIARIGKEYIIVRENSRSSGHRDEYYIKGWALKTENEKEEEDVAEVQPENVADLEF